MSATAIFGYILLSLTLGYVFVYSSFGQISSLLDQKIGYEESLATIMDIESKKQMLEEEFNKVPEEVKEDINTILPNAFDVVKLVAEIDNVASEYGILIDDINFREIEDLVGDTIGELVPSTSYNRGLVSFSFYDTTHKKYKDFMNDLEKSLRILDIKSVDITTGSKGLNTYKVEFETYWLKPS